MLKPGSLDTIAWFGKYGGDNHELSMPGSFSYDKGRLYVLDTQNHKVSVFRVEE